MPTSLITVGRRRPSSGCSTRRWTMMARSASCCAFAALDAFRTEPTTDLERLTQEIDAVRALFAEANRRPRPHLWTHQQRVCALSGGSSRSVNARAAASASHGRSRAPPTHPCSGSRSCPPEPHQQSPPLETRRRLRSARGVRRRARTDEHCPRASVPTPSNDTNQRPMSAARVR